jgi:Fe-S cluster assembly ATP-binding protein
MTAALVATGLTASIGQLEILHGVDLEVPFGEVHALMGPNGSGKSTLTHVLMGKPGYDTAGSATVDGTELLGSDVDARAEAGVFATFQYPVEIPGVTLSELVTEMAASDPSVAERAEIAAEQLAMAPFLDRAVNFGLSGGEKKRSEIYQLLTRRPKLAVLDEIDSGLDIDAVREVAAAVEAMRRSDLGVLIITHYTRILRYLTVDRVHVLFDGRIVRSGGPEVADELEADGYEGHRAESAVAPPDPFTDL